MKKKNHETENNNEQKKNRPERESSVQKEFLQKFELIKLSGLSDSKIKTAIKNGELESSQTCKRGVHLFHIEEARRWLQGRKK